MGRGPIVFSKRRGTSEAEVDAIVDAAIGGDQFDFVESFPTWQIATTATVTANSAFLTLVRVGRPLTVTTMTYVVGAAAGTVDLGIYTANATDFVRQASTGAVTAAGSSTTQTISLTAPYTMLPGVDYWLAYLPSNGATQTCGRTNGTTPASYQNRAISKAIGAATLPATIAKSGVAGGAAVWLVAAP